MVQPEKKMPTILVRIHKNSKTRRKFYSYCKHRGLDLIIISSCTANGTYNRRTGQLRVGDEDQIKEFPHTFSVSGSIDELTKLTWHSMIEYWDEGVYKAVLPAQGQVKKEGSHSEERHS